MTPIPATSPSGFWQSGIPSILGTHLIWGVLPLYFALTAPATAFEVVAARVLFSLLFCTLLLSLIRGSWGTLWHLLRQGRLMGLVSLASLLVGANWLMYVFATTTGHTLDASLGYFINPLLSVFLGVIFLGERLRRLQQVAVILAAVAVVSMSIFYGKVPWIGLGLAATFGFYGLVKSKVGGRISPLHSFTVESLMLSPLAVLAMLALGLSGTLTLFTLGAEHFWVLAASGVITALPLLLFADAASKLPLSLVGMVQYLSPTLQFLIALYIFREPLEPTRLAGFIVIWCACALFAFDAVRASRINRRVQAGLAHPATGALEVLPRRPQ